LNRRKQQPTMPRWRGRLLVGLFALAALTLEGRLVWLQLFEGDFLTAEGAERQLRVVETPAHRGVLRDRNGEPLAVSTPVDSLYVNPRLIAGDRDAIDRLAAAVGRDGDELAESIESRRDREFLWLARREAPADAARVLDLGIDGVGSQREYKRFYPHGEVTCHLLGFTGDQDIAQEGLEVVYDARLSGRPGSKLVQRDRRGRIIADVEQIEPVHPGTDVRLSLDLRLQYTAYRALKSAVQASGASSGSVVLLDIWTGEVLALVNQPVCNPNDSSQRAELSRFRNRAITDPVEPGSTVKPLIMTAVLQSGYTPDTVVDVPKVLVIDGQELTNDPSRLGKVTVTEILARSSSVGIGMIGADLESRLIWETLKGYGFGQPTGDELGVLENYGVLSNAWSGWDQRTRATMSYGYTLSVTPLQLARAYAAIGTGGSLPRISFEARAEPLPKTHALDAALAEDLMAMLEVVVSADGTASRAAIPGYRVAGKTGTVEIAEAGRYSDDKRRAIFAGIAPAGDPRFVATVVINDPRSQAYHGGDVAAPVFARIMGTALRMYGVPPDDLPADESVLISRAEVGR